MTTDARFEGPGPDTYFLQGLNDGKLLLQHCQSCTHDNFPPALVCRQCGETSLIWRESSGKGVVYAVTTVRDRAGSYNVSLIDLEGGARMMSRVEGVEPDFVQIGQSVNAQIVHGEMPHVVFTLTGKKHE